MFLERDAKPRVVTAFALVCLLLASCGNTERSRDSVSPDADSGTDASVVVCPSDPIVEELLSGSCEPGASCVVTLQPSCKPEVLVISSSAHEWSCECMSWGWRCAPVGEQPGFVFCDDGTDGGDGLTLHGEVDCGICAPKWYSCWPKGSVPRNSGVRASKCPEPWELDETQYPYCQPANLDFGPPTEHGGLCCYGTSTFCH